MDLQSIYKRLGLEGSDALISVSSDDEWKKKTSFPSRVYRCKQLQDVWKKIQENTLWMASEFK